MTTSTPREHRKHVPLYGDPAAEIEIPRFARALLEQLPLGRGLAAERAALIACGQLEQAVIDAADAPRDLRAAACAATDHAARAFYASFAQLNRAAPAFTGNASTEVEAMREQLAQLAAAPAVRGVLKIPEGFAFYALYPEQYCAAALHYLADHGRPSGIVHVLGLRSIGTTLSAAVSAVLRAAGVEHRRATVRPQGHPFARRVELESHGHADAALIVDEGPGLSGSSFYAAARALEANGISLERQALFSAHGAPPGAKASDEVREFWQRARRYVAAEHESAVSPDGSLLETLAGELERRFGGPVASLRDISGGAWRTVACADRAAWPAAYPAFERPKLLAELRDGRRLFLKFYGQVLCPNSDTELARWSDRAAEQRIAEDGTRVARSHGYLVRPWCEGQIASRSDENPARPAQLAAFLAARPWRRQRAAENIADAYFGCSGRLGPENWLRSRHAGPRKLPETLHGYDHSAIDAQPLGWDIAGAIVEWDLSHSEIANMLAEFGARSTLRLELGDVREHVQRYAEFHAERAAFCAEQGTDEDAARLRAEAARYLAWSEQAEAWST
jgi:hypothetical protein